MAHLFGTYKNGNEVTIGLSIVFLDSQNNLITLEPNSLGGYDNNDLVDYIKVLENGKLEFDQTCIDLKVANPGIAFNMNDTVLTDETLQLISQTLLK